MTNCLWITRFWPHEQSYCVWHETMSFLISTDESYNTGGSLLVSLDISFSLHTIFLIFPFPKKLLSSMAKQSLVSVYFKINVTESKYVNYSVCISIHCFSFFKSLDPPVSRDTSSSACDYSAFSLPKPFVTQKAAPVKKDLPKEKPG